MFTVAHSLWYVRCGTFTVAHFLWYVWCCGISTGIFSVVHPLWHVYCGISIAECPLWHARNVRSGMSNIACAMWYIQCGKSIMGYLLCPTSVSCESSFKLVCGTLLFLGRPMKVSNFCYITGSGWGDPLAVWLSCFSCWEAHLNGTQVALFSIAMCFAIQSICVAW